MEEAWLERFPGEDESVHLQSFFDTPQEWANPALIEKWKRVRDLRRVVTGALELKRAAKEIGSSLEAAPILQVDEADAEILSSIPFAEIAITSGITIIATPPDEGAFMLPDVKNAAVQALSATGEKCARCWMVLDEVTHHATHLCNRCTAAVAG
jgi:isoleucyl-tRNA synthetase